MFSILVLDGDSPSTFVTVHSILYALPAVKLLIIIVLDDALSPFVVFNESSASVATHVVVVIGFPPVSLGGVTTIDREVVVGRVIVPRFTVGACGLIALSTLPEVLESILLPNKLFAKHLKDDRPC